ncbi:MULTISPECIES: ABC transporter permease [Aeromonas]|uniref:ABC transporter permease n=1 Tax=Aeromonas TaxID=642 RepID=UPI0022E1BBA6|nr:MULTISPECIES: ABC transporter permease [Aeromonas]WED82473.1 ABC transporter permease [Aeromonas media]
MGFILRRFSFYLVAFLVAATINFLLPRAMPGDPVSVMFARAGAMMEPAALEALKATFGFVDGPITTQFLAYVKSVFTWDLGTSVRYYPQPVADVLGRAIGWTLFLVGTSTILSFSIGSIVGIFAAWYRGGRMDSILSPLTLVMQAIPPVVVSLLALFLFGVSLGWLPIGYAYSPEIPADFGWEHIKSIMLHAIMPVGTLAIVQVGGFLITMRNNMINLLGEDYITMAKAKGLSSNRVIFNYGARNAVLPSVTALSMALGFVIGGSLITEVIFNYPGLGLTLYQGILARDYPLIQGQLLIMTITMLSFNFLADVLYVFLDPRLRTGGK